MLFGLLLLGVNPILAEDHKRFYLLVVGPDEGVTQKMVQRVEELRERLGFSLEGMPLRHLPEQTPYRRRLGIDSSPFPVLGVVLWNVPEHLGPRRFVGDTFAAPAGLSDVPRVVQSFLRLQGHRDKALPPFEPADSLPIAGERGLLVKSLRFECSGSPLLVTNFAVRIQNESLSTIRNIKVRFFVRRSTQLPWRLCQEKVLEKIASHQVFSSDFIGRTGDLGLLDSAKNAVSCFYRVEVENDGVVIESSGRFVPSERPVSP